MHPGAPGNSVLSYEHNKMQCISFYFESRREKWKVLISMYKAQPIHAKCSFTLYQYISKVLMIYL